MKKELYKREEFCMSFSAKEVEEGFIAKLKNIANISIQADYEGPNGSIDYVCIQLKNTDLAIRFYGFETAIFIYNEKIMLVDDVQKRKYTLDHIYGNVVYAGSLRELTHEEILELLFELTKCFIECIGVKVEVRAVAPLTADSYGENSYKISVFLEQSSIESKVFSNIEINFVSVDAQNKSFIQQH